MKKIDGKKIAKEIASGLKKQVAELRKKPVLAVISIDQNDVGESYIKSKKSFGESIGVDVSLHKFSEDTDPEVLRLSVRAVIDSSDCAIVQLPLPKHLDERKILNLIPPEKDPDVLNSFSKELFEKCKGSVLPPVAGAIAEILQRNDVSLKGKKVVVLGKGRLVGAPVAAWLRCNGMLPKAFDKKDDPKVIEEALKNADAIISGIGSPNFVKSNMIKDGVVLIDAGTSGQSGQVFGDIDPSCAKKSSLYTPVPGGVGPIAVAKLFENLLILIKNKK
jgi:methylenetetrahydrofolate dehydrogenase (NADP+)/methenyltetrahydrofolate cyclohydrolase